MTGQAAFPKKIGLALGGGGARGLAHIPVLEAFDDLGIKPYKIAGTSIGSIIGAGYASGQSGEDLRRIVLDLFADNNKVLNRLWQLRPKRFKDVFRAGPVQFDPLKVLNVFVSEYLPDTFDDLQIPLRVLATDFYGCEEVDFETGPLLPAIAASISIPAVFRPVRHQGRFLIDGGVVNPLPFDGLRSQCDIVVAVDVVGAPVARTNPADISTLDSLFGSSQILMQTITSQKIKMDQPDILIRPQNGNIRILDFLKAESILDSSESLRALTRTKLTELLNTSMEIT
ncbi:patatin-like phospholipase family protein [Roseibium sp.]|uniref:patatin-like phospholipase family protein n=1 Tax=Roseibium sp. TaxID=1936156 RepID=UPI003B529061